MCSMCTYVLGALSVAPVWWVFVVMYVVAFLVLILVDGILWLFRLLVVFCTILFRLHPRNFAAGGTWWMADEVLFVSCVRQPFPCRSMYQVRLDDENSQAPSCRYIPRSFLGVFVRRVHDAMYGTLVLESGVFASHGILHAGETPAQPLMKSKALRLS